MESTLPTTNIIQITPGVIMGGALMFVAGNAWNDAVKDTIDTVIPDKNKSLSIRYIYAILITVLMLIIAYTAYDVSANVSNTPIIAKIIR